MKAHKYIIAAAIGLSVSACSNQPQPEAATDNKDLVMEQPTTMTVSIEGMTCAVGCAATIQQECGKLAGVAVSKVDFDAKSGTFTYDAAKLTQADLIKCIEGVNGGGAYKATVLSAGDAVPAGTEAINEDAAHTQGAHS
jgi:Cu+-exporting ATPase